jgi:two-component system cell cycle response regulator CtrA
MDEPEVKIIDVFICKLRKKLANASSGHELY